MATERRDLASGNLFCDVPRLLDDEQFAPLATGRGLRIERIVSTGHTTPEGEWYDQENEEWVLLLRGRARLAFEEREDELEMGPGDHVLIPARCRHRVTWTDPVEPAIWLAIHYEAE